VQVVVVADTGPLNYLVQINAVDLLPKLFGRITVPAAVHDELRHPRTPVVVRNWIAQVPDWLEIRANPGRKSSIAMPASLDEGEGERAAIALAADIDAHLILLDDRGGVSFARAQGFAVTGTLGVLDLAARRGLINLVEAFTRLKATTFHYRQGLLDALLAQQPEAEK
jgi:predicted nucleic acid-binding protein